MKIKVTSAPRFAVNRNVIKYLLLSLLFLLLFLLQFTPGFFPKFGRVSAYLIVPAIVSIALFERETVGTIFGLVGGMMWDFVSAEIDGFHALILMATGCICGLLIDYLMRNNLFSGFFVTLAATFAHIFFYWFFFIAMRGYAGSWYALGCIYLPSVLYTMVFFVPIYYLVKLICKISPAAKRQR